MVPLILGPIISMLADKGLEIASQAVAGGLDKGVQYIEEKTGIKLDASKGLNEDDVKSIQRLERDPATRIELEKLALENKKEDNRHEESMVKADHDNTANARKMQEAALGQEDLFSKRFVYYFGTVWSIFAMVYVMLITFATIPASNVRFADTILGFVLGTVIASIINYFVGSSSSSKDKDEHIKTLTKGK